jgi:hypothetical protein
MGLWNEPSAEARPSLIAELWSEHGRHVLQPPEEMRVAAARLGFSEPTLEARGHTALEARVARAYEEFVEPGQYLFRSRGNAERLHDHVKFNWEMVSRAAGEVAAVGLEVLFVDEDDRFRVDYQFIEP